MQTDKKFGLGGNLEPVSTYGGKQYEMSITIHKVQNMLYLCKADKILVLFLMWDVLRNEPE